MRNSVSSRAAGERSAGSTASRVRRRAAGEQRHRGPQPTTAEPSPESTAGQPESGRYHQGPQPKRSHSQRSPQPRVCRRAAGERYHRGPQPKRSRSAAPAPSPPPGGRRAISPGPVAQKITTTAPAHSPPPGSRRAISPGPVVERGHARPPQPRVRSLAAGVRYHRGHSPTGHEGCSRSESAAE